MNLIHSDFVINLNKNLWSTIKNNSYRKLWVFPNWSLREVSKVLPPCAAPRPRPCERSESGRAAEPTREQAGFGRQTTFRSHPETLPEEGELENLEKNNIILFGKHLTENRIDSQQEEVGWIKQNPYQNISKRL